jgi:hypothetical protein
MRRACDALIDRFCHSTCRGAHPAAARRCHFAGSPPRGGGRDGGTAPQRRGSSTRPARVADTPMQQWPSEAVRLTPTGSSSGSSPSSAGRCHGDVGDDERAGGGHRARRRLHPGSRLAVVAAAVPGEGDIVLDLALLRAARPRPSPPPEQP